MVAKDLPYLSQPIKKKIQKAVEAKLINAPQEFGEPLRRTLKGYWKLRVGDYRVIYKVTVETVTVLKIGHRSDVYKWGK